MVFCTFFTYFVLIFSIDGTVISLDKKSTLNSANFSLGTSALMLSKRLIKSGSSLKYCGRSSCIAAATLGTLKHFQITSPTPRQKH